MPLGVVAVVYEARPNVTVDAAVLCLKTVPTPIPFMGGNELPQLVFLGQKAG